MWIELRPAPAATRSACQRAMTSGVSSANLSGPRYGETCRSSRRRPPARTRHRAGTRSDPAPVAAPHDAGRRLHRRGRRRPDRRAHRGCPQRLAEVPAPRVTCDRALIRPEAIVLPAIPCERVAAIRAAIREAFPDAGLGEAPEPRAGFLPHVSVAYVSQDGPAQPIGAALGRVATSPTTVTISAASLIVLDRDIHMYRWGDYAVAPIGKIPPPRWHRPSERLNGHYAGHPNEEDLSRERRAVNAGVAFSSSPTAAMRGGQDGPHDSHPAPPDVCRPARRYRRDSRPDRAQLQTNVCRTRRYAQDSSHAARTQPRPSPPSPGA